MRKGLFLLLAVALGALFIGGCTTGTGETGDKIDTEAFFPNEKDNYWTYLVEGDGADYNQTQTIMDEPDVLLAGQQRIRIQNDSDDDGDYLDVEITDNETNSLQMTGLELYQNGSRVEREFWDDNPFMMLVWDDYGINDGDEWDAWEITGFDNPWFWGLPDGLMDSLGMLLTAEVDGTDDFTYGDDTLTAYKIVVSGDATFEQDDEDPEDWGSYNWQRDYYFVPEFGYVKIQEYQEQYGQMIEADTYTLIDTNVPVPTQ